MSDAACVVVLTTLPATADAAAFARALVDERLASCITVLPGVQTTYRWQGAVTEDREQQLLIKTAAERVPALQTRLVDLHPYDVPEFIVLPVAAGSAAYLGWVHESTVA